MARLLRRKSQFLIAYGSCAHQRRHSRPGQPVPPRADPEVQLRRRADAGQRRAQDTAPVEVRRSRPRSLAARAPQRRPRSGPGGRGGLLRPGLSADAEHHQGGHHRAARRQAAAERLGPGARHCAVRRVPAQEDQADEPQHHRVQAPAPIAGRPGALLPGARRRLHGAGDPQRLRRPVHDRQHALHRLLRPHLAGARPGPQDHVLGLRQRRAEGRRGHRQSARRHPRSHRHLLPLRPREEHAAPQGQSPGQWQVI